MLCLGTNAVVDDACVKSREIDRRLRVDEKKAAREVKMLLLGQLKKTVKSPS
jgi:hypothetical protein